jgi:hypothetical protein
MDKLKNGSKRPDLYGVWEVNSAASKLGSQASTIGARHISDGTLRLQFTREVTHYANAIVRDVENGVKSISEGLKALAEEQRSLLNQSLDVAQKGVGVVAGAAQIYAGGSICYASLGTLCVAFGVPLMAHGANNVYENGRNLLEGRSDTEGPVRDIYQSAAKVMGKGELEGNIAYGVADLGMSVYGLSRLALKPDSWRLFRYVREDYVRAYKSASTSSLVLEGVSDGITVRTLSDQLQGD